MPHKLTLCDAPPLSQCRGKSLQTNIGRLIGCPNRKPDSGVPRKPKTAADQTASSDTGENAPQPSVLPPAAVRKVAKRDKSGGAKKKTTRSTAPKRTKAQAAPASGSSGSANKPSDDDIRLRAYFIAERRTQLSIPGSEAEDWLEAKRQLEAESRGDSA
jgi:hypothetical protein